MYPLMAQAKMKILVWNSSPEIQATAIASVLHPCVMWRYNPPFFTTVPLPGSKMQFAIT